MENQVWIGYPVMTKHVPIGLSEIKWHTFAEEYTPVSIEELKDKIREATKTFQFHPFDENGPILPEPDAIVEKKT